MIWLLGCWIGEDERAAWLDRHGTAPEADADTDTDADTDADTDTDTDADTDTEVESEATLFLDASRADATFAGLQGGARVGSSVALGDVDGDGERDVIVGAPGAGLGDASGAGVVYGFTAAGSGLRPVTEANFLFGGRTTSANAGTALAAGADLDADGYGDLVVGGPGNATVWVLSGPVPVRSDADTVDALTGAPGSETGAAVAFLGQCDGDGLADLVIGAPGIDRAFVVYGAFLHTGELGPEDGMLLGDDGARTGAAVAGPGDVDGDGLDDVLIGAPAHPEGALTDAGFVYLLHGPPPPEQSLGVADAVLVGEKAGSGAGTSVAGAGDVDGDGRADVLVGGAEGFWLVVNPGPGKVSLAEARAVYGNDAMAGNVSVSAAGDIDEDGRADLAVGSSGRDDRQGAVWLFYGLVEGGLGVDDVVVAVAGLEPGDELGFALAGAPDRGGRTLLIGAPGRGLDNHGAAYLFPDIGR